MGLFGIITKNGGGGGSGGANITVAANYSAILALPPVLGQFYWASSSQGTSWLPGSLGGTYYNSGLYYYNGTSLEFLNVPYQATQAEVNTGTNTDKFVTPETLANTTQVVHRTGDETVGGVKTFTNSISALNLSGTNTGDNATNSQYSGLAASKQDTLVSGTNIKTINGSSVLGSGDLPVTGITAATLASTITGATSKATLVDADELPITDSAASFGLKKLTWANLKTNISTFFLAATNTFSALNTFSFRAVFSGQISTRSAINLPNSATDVTSGAVNGDIKNVSHVLSFFKNGTWRRFLFAEDNPSLTGTGTVVVTVNTTGDFVRGNNIVSLFAYTQTTMPTVVAATLTSILTGTIQGSTTLNSSTDTTNPMMVAGKSYRGFASGIFSSVSGATFQIVIKIGSVTLLDSGAFTMIANTAQPFRIEFDYTVQTTGVSGAITANLIFMINGQTPFIASGSPVTIDTTANRILDVQVAYGATNASNTVNIRQANTINHAN